MIKYHLGEACISHFTKTKLITLAELIKSYLGSWGRETYWMELRK